MKNALQIILFIFLAIPGALAFVIASILLAGKVIDPKADLPNSGELLLVCLVGIVFTLIGIGKIKKLMYSLVFITFPISFWFWALINPRMFGGLIAMLGFVVLAVFGCLRAVQYYYKELPNQLENE